VNRHHRVLVSVMASTLLAMAALLSLAGSASAGTSPPPDPQAVGGLTLCGHNGQQITSGTVSTKPAIWRVIDTTAAPKGYAKNGTATLYAFQLRPDVPPGDWSGEQLTASARYTDGAHPMAAATTADESLATYFGDYPLSAVGLVQIRVFLGAPNMPQYSILYDASYLHVSGNSWTQLNPGPSDCSSAGKSVSVETLTLPKKDFKVTPSPTPSGAGHPRTSSSTPSTTSSSGGSANSNGNGSAGTNAADTASDSSSTSHAGRNIAIVIVVGLLVALGGGLALRRRA
jgi:hypothetical protein